MSDKKFSALTAVAACADANEFALNEAGTSKKATLAQMRTQLGATSGPASSTDTAIVTYSGTTGKLVQDNPNTAIDVNGNATVNSVAVSAGTVSAPGFVVGAGANGLYQPGSNQVAVTTNGVQRVLVSTAAVTSTLPIVAPAGTVSAPSLTTTGDLDTGAYFPAANTVAIAAGGVDAARFNTVASGVDYLTVTPSAAGSPGLVVVGAAGSDTNIGINLVPKGSGQVGLPAGVVATPGIAFSAALNRGIYAANGGLHVSVGGVNYFGVDSSGNVNVRSSNVMGWVSSTPDAGSPTTGLSQLAAGVVGIGTGAAASTAGWYNYGGTSRVTGDVTNNTATMAAVTGLSATLIAGRSYIVKLYVKCINSTATEGIQFDFNGGNATMTDFWMGAGVLASGGTDVLGSNISTSLSGVINFTTFTGESVITFVGYIKCANAGTFIPRFAENTTAVGTATVRKGTSMVLVDTP